MIAKTIIKTVSGSMFVLENDGLTRFSECPIRGNESLMIRNEPFIIHTLEVGKPAIFELTNHGGLMNTSVVLSIEDQLV